MAGNCTFVSEFKTLLKRGEKNHPHRISSANSADEFVFNSPGTKCRVNVYPGI